MASLVLADIGSMSRARRTNFVTVVVFLFLLGALVAGGITAFDLHNGPEATWRFGPERQAVAPFDEVPMLDPVILEVRVPFTAWVYAVSFSHAGGCRAQFPSDYLATDLENPLPAGTHRLPGRLEGKDLEWFVHGVKGEAVSYILVVSKRPLPDLHERMKTLFQIGNTAFPDGSFGSYIPKGGKAVLPEKHRIPHPLLKQAAYDRDAAVDGPMLEVKHQHGVFIRVMHVIPKDQRRG